MRVPPLRRSAPGDPRPRDPARSSRVPALLACGLLVGGLLAGVGTMAPARATGGSASAALLDEVIAEYVERVRGADGGSAAGSLAAASFLEAIEEDRELLARARAVDPEELSLSERVDRALLVGILESEVRLAEGRRVWENDPALYVPAGAIGRQLEALASGAPDTAERLAATLARVPRGLEHGRANLDRPPRRFTDAAIFQSERTLESLREVAATADAQAPRTPRTPALEAALRGAIEALQRYLAFLHQELVPRSDGSWALGRELYDHVLERRWFLDDDADAILARGRRAFEATEAQAQRVAERIRPGAHWVQVYEELKDDHPPADGIKAAYQAQMDTARAFVRAERIVTLPEGERVITVDTPPALRRSSPFGTFQTVDPFGDDLEGRLVLTPVEDWLSEEQMRERLRSHHRAWIPLIAVHEAYPGHHAQAIKARGNPRPLRRVVNESIYSEGWGLYTEQLMFDLGFLQGDDVRLTMLRNRLWRAARVILDASLHTGRMTFDEAVDFLVERVRFERYAAELEVGMYLQRPTYVLGYLIGMQEIAAIRNDWVAANGAPDPPSELWDAFLTTGSIPPALVRAELLGEPLPRR